MIYEYRRYTVEPGRLADLQARFHEVVFGLFEEHGITVVGMWETLVGRREHLHYLVSWESTEEMMEKWGAFVADPRWPETVEKYDRNGPLVGEMHNELWYPVPGAPGAS